MSSFPGVNASLQANMRGAKRYAEQGDLRRGIAGTAASLQRAAHNIFATGNFRFNGSLPNGLFKTPGSDPANYGMLPSAHDDVNPVVEHAGRVYCSLHAYTPLNSLKLPLPTKMQPVFALRREPPPRGEVSGSIQIREAIRAMPMPAGAVDAMNAALAALQIQWMNQDALAYRNITPRMLLYGLPKDFHRDTAESDYDALLLDAQPIHEMEIVQRIRKLRGITNWAGFTLDGVVRVSEERPSNGLAARMQMSMSRAHFADFSMAASGVQSMLPTTQSRGTADVKNVWGSVGFTVGARLGFLLRKCAPGRYDTAPDDQSVLRYTLLKNVGLTGAEADAQQTVDINSKYTGPDDRDAPKLCLPYQLVPYAIPDGGACPFDMYEYRDEVGIQHNDAVFLELGRVLGCPTDQTLFVPQVTSADELTPFMNGAKVRESNEVLVILNADDGVFSSA